MIWKESCHAEMKDSKKLALENKKKASFQVLLLFVLCCMDTLNYNFMFAERKKNDVLKCMLKMLVTAACVMASRRVSLKLLLHKHRHTIKATTSDKHSSLFLPFVGLVHFKYSPTSNKYCSSAVWYGLFSLKLVSYSCSYRRNTIDSFSGIRAKVRLGMDLYSLMHKKHLQKKPHLPATHLLWVSNARNERQSWCV